MSTHEQFLTTLRRIPDDVILSMATRPIELRGSQECVCGWAARELNARRGNYDAADETCIPTETLAREVGGDEHTEWLPINWAYANPSDAAELELAFADRVLEAAS